MNLLYCVDYHVLGIFLCSLRSIVLHGGYEHYDVYVLHSCFDEKMEAAINHDFKGIMTFHFIRVPDSLFTEFPETDRYPKEIYYRLAAPFLLPEDLSRVLYLDTDTIVINSLQELYETDFEGNGYAGCTHARKLLTKINQIRLKSEKAEVYVNTGVLLMNLPVLRETVNMQEISEYVHEHMESMILPDQDILAALYGDKIKLLDTLIYNLSDRVMNIHNTAHPHHKIDLPWIHENAVVIHYCGRNKPWKDDYIGELGVFYEEFVPKQNKQC